MSTSFCLYFSIFFIWPKSKNDGTRNGFLSRSCFLDAYRHIYRYPCTTASTYGWKASGYSSVLSISKENAKYKKLVDDIVEKLPDFENVENCKRNCKSDSYMYFYPEVTTNMSEEAQNLGNGHAIVDGMDSKKLTTSEHILQSSRPKRAITSSKLPFYFSKIE